MAAPLLQTRDLGMRFGGVQAVRNVNFTLAEGELRCLIGPNGAGKSTFFKMLTGQLQPTEGMCCSAAKTFHRATPHEIARLGIGIKTQVPSVFDGLSVRENIWLAASRHPCGAARQCRGRRDAGTDRPHRVADAHGRPARPRSAAMGRTRHRACRPIPSSILLDEPAAGMTA